MVVHEHLAVSVHQVVAGTARLRAGAAVGTATRQILAQVALPAVAHAERTVDKELQQAGIGDGGADGANLVERKLAFENKPRKAQTGQRFRPFGRADGRLRGSVQFNGGEIQC